MSQPGKSMTIMVVDDSTMIQKIIKRELEAGGYTVICFGDGMEAMSALSWMEDPPDLITLDIDMPKMDGFMACEYLRSKEEEGLFADKGRGPIPVLFVSANDTIDNRRRGFSLGSLNFIAKPFGPGDISTAVNDVLRPLGRFDGMSALVVDDSVVVRQMIGRCVNKMGAAYCEAGNGIEALQLLNEKLQEIDLLIVDFTMPKMKGDELVRQLRKMEGGARLPVLFVSAAGETHDILNMFRSGATDYLQKPFIAEELQARIGVHFEARKYMLELEELNRNLYERAVYDGLTRLHNKRYLLDNLDRSFSIAIRGDEELSCIFFDIDFFKKVNDSCGHQFGDYVLRVLGTLVKENVRNGDLAVRYGGEEFVIIMPRATLAAAAQFGERFRHIVEDYPFEDEPIKRPITISLGISSLQEHEPTSPSSLLEFADQALYRAKEAGRNQVALYQG